MVCLVFLQQVLVGAESCSGTGSYPTAALGRGCLCCVPCACPQSPADTDPGPQRQQGAAAQCGCLGELGFHHHEWSCHWKPGWALEWQALEVKPAVMGSGKERDSWPLCWGRSPAAHSLSPGMVWAQSQSCYRYGRVSKALMDIFRQNE